jgi:glycosyltransferase involved in cell wall biosynthesis
MSKSPLISIGVPAYNSEAHIGLTLEGLLGQTCPDFEIIVSDNASTDGTRDVVERYRAQDARIRYERQPTNVGANPNYAHVVNLARGEFFKWSSSSDWCAPTFLGRCLEVLQSNPDTVLSVPRTRLFQNTPDEYEDYPWDIELPDERPSARLVRLTTTLALNNAMNGIIRTAALRRTRIMEAYLGADYVLMGHLALLGKFRLVEDRLFYRRMESATATALADRAAVWRHHYPTLSGRTLFQGIKRHLGWARIAMSTSIPMIEKLRSLEHVARRCFWDREAILKDLRGAWHYYTRGTWPD